MKHTFDRTSIVMIRSVTKSILTICTALLTLQSHAQTTYELVIDSLIGIPDTVVDGENVMFFMTVSTTAPLFYQGSIYPELQYAGGFFPADSSVVSNTVLGPAAPVSIQAFHRFSSDDGLSIGENVVVVWPRIGDGITPDQSVPNPFTATITLVEPSGIGEYGRKRDLRPFAVPNPANGLVHFRFNPSEKLIQVTLRDLFGRTVMQRPATDMLDITGISRGIYTVEALMENGSVMYDRLLIAR